MSAEVERHTTKLGDAEEVCHVPEKANGSGDRSSMMSDEHMCNNVLRLRLGWVTEKARTSSSTGMVHTDGQPHVESIHEISVRSFVRRQTCIGSRKE